MQIETGPLRRPFAGAGRATVFHCAGVAVQAGVVLVLAAPWIYFVPTALWAVAVAAVVPAAGVVLAGPLLTRVQRARFRDRLGVRVPAPVGLAERPGPRGLRRWLGSAPGRRQLRYHLLAAPLCALGGLLVAALWAAGAASATVYVWLWVTPWQWWVHDAGYTAEAAYVTVAGAALLYAAAWLAKALARRDARAARALLGPSREEELTRRVADLAESRAAVVDAADAERRRIERDLHDGVQQRLVALAVNLGLARATLGELPADVRTVLDEAHREAKEAIAELNDLVRGLHPAVLEDRGLDAALSGVAARLPVPVRLAVRLARRPSPTVEAVAYFVVSEALTNVVKHARASRAEVTVEERAGTLVVAVSDDGVGGADASGGSGGSGTGLAGLAKRVASVDGVFSCRSPVGGPTVVTVELPCVP
ncbi:sensor domain-containing protein [Streptomyces roseirectus]|uniref:Oxygen sensor histidine kinase NreB n=1 Tax=Streptomyces roseirectus TaxID=2768066 RepID=A0A7H0IJT2_9ACTN|nr:histidine kinase [Streptomyces roseirectus]QNP73048.1 sensor domain-containing protein [Streptomyces roseirectus]